MFNSRVQTWCFFKSQVFHRVGYTEGPATNSVKDAIQIDAIQIQDALPEEMDETAAVLGAAYGEYAASIPPELWKGYHANIVDVRSRLHESELVVSEHEGRLVGTITFYPQYNRDRRSGRAFG